GKAGAVIAWCRLVRASCVGGHHQPLGGSAAVEDAEGVVEGAVEGVVVGKGRTSEADELHIAPAVERAQLCGGGAVPAPEGRSDDRVGQGETAHAGSVDAVALHIVHVHVVQRNVRGRVHVDAVAGG